MEGYDRDTPADVHHLDRRADSRHDNVKLAVDLYSYCLKAALCGVMSPDLCRRGHRRLDYADQLARRFDRGVFSLAYNVGGDLRRESLLAVFVKYSLELALRISVHDVIRRHSGAAVHSHIERSICHIGKSALGSVELVGRNSKIKQDSVYFIYSEGCTYLCNICKVVAGKQHPVAKRLEPFARSPDRRFVLIYRDQRALGKPFGNQIRVIAAPCRTVDDRSSRTNVKPLYTLAGHDRAM